MASGTIDRNALVAEFRSFLAADAVLDDAEELKPYECDGLTAYRQTPLLVVLPETIEQVQRVLRVCTNHQVPVVMLRMPPRSNQRTRPPNSAAATKPARKCWSRKPMASR